MDEIENTDRKLEKRYALDNELELVRTVPGIGLATAKVIKAESGDMTRFSSSKDLAAYVS